jgi:hypothetical protein
MPALVALSRYTGVRMRIVLFHALIAVAWAWIAQWPWGGYLFHTFAAIGVFHALAPFWFHFSGVRPFHRAFLFGPLALAAIDAMFLLYAWRGQIWSDLTYVFVPILGAIAAVALLYALLVMSLLDGWRTRREAKKQKPEAGAN